MYYGTVNRGIFFTKAGIYSLGLVLVLGFLATGSGSNALYLSLSLSLSILVVSGLLSEKVIQNIDITTPTLHEARAQQPFHLACTLGNRSPVLSLFGIEVLVVQGVPRFKLFSDKTRGLLQGTALFLGPKVQEAVWLSSSGLARGVYQDLSVVVRTRFPFGLIIKFSLERIPLKLRVVPAWDAVLGERFRKELMLLFLQASGQETFLTHRPFFSRDSLRHVDWRKSAGKKVSQWLVKVSESPTDFSRVEIVFRLATLHELRRPEQREEFLSRLYSLLQVVWESGRIASLSCEFFQLHEKEAILDFLANYISETSPLPPIQPLEGMGTQGLMRRIIFDGKEYRWLA